jgi:hypothetical protein
MSGLRAILIGGACANVMYFILAVVMEQPLAAVLHTMATALAVTLACWVR